MTKKQREKAIRELSPRAFALYQRVCNQALWYASHDPNTPQAMKELFDARLVTMMGRVAVIKSCFVPTGSKPFKIEKFPTHERS